MIGIRANQVERFPQRDGRDQQHMFVAKWKEVWALPDRASFGLIADTQRVQILPFDQVARAIQQRLQQRRAANAIDLAADHLIPITIFLPNTVVAKIKHIHICGWLGNHRVARVFVPC
jgi:hypothetical protein